MSNAPRLVSIGDETGRDVEVTIGPKFLQLFSEQLYTSPNKAFEELVSNSWDAGAELVHIGIPSDLGAESVIWVLDDGESMDEDGLRYLWAVGDDHKVSPDWDRPKGRELIGKFGIGKLATYVLADELTYVCRARDGVIRAVSVDFREILRRADAQRLHMDPLSLPVRLVDEAALPALLEQLGLSQVATLLSSGRVGRDWGLNGESDAESTEDSEEAEASASEEASGSEDSAVEPGGVSSETNDSESEEGLGDVADLDEDEFHSGALEQHESDAEQGPATWTLVALSSLKPRGLEVSRGQVKRMLRAALPLSGNIEIVADGDALRPSKADAVVDRRWVLGEDFVPTGVVLEGSDPPVPVNVEGVPGDNPHVKVEGVGVITGEIRLYEKSIAGGKSAARGASNGFAVNVRGRTINLHDPQFGLPALSHAAWAKTRVAVRCDSLNDELSVSREAVDAGPEVDAFRGFLRACFNHARSHYASGRQFPDVHELLRDEWGTVPISPLLHAVELAVDDQLTVDLVDVGGIEDRGGAAAGLRHDLEERPEGALKDIEAQAMGQDERLARYRLTDRSVIVNQRSPVLDRAAHRRH